MQKVGLNWKYLLLYLAVFVSVHASDTELFLSLMNLPDDEEHNVQTGHRSDTDCDDFLIPQSTPSPLPLPAPFASSMLTPDFLQNRPLQPPIDFQLEPIDGDRFVDSVLAFTGTPKRAVAEGVVNEGARAKRQRMLMLHESPVPDEYIERQPELNNTIESEAVYIAYLEELCKRNGIACPQRFLERTVSHAQGVHPYQRFALQWTNLARRLHWCSYQESMSEIETFCKALPREVVQQDGHFMQRIRMAIVQRSCKEFLQAVQNKRYGYAPEYTFEINRLYNCAKTHFSLIKQDQLKASYFYGHRLMSSQKRYNDLVMEISKCTELVKHTLGVPISLMPT